MADIFNLLDELNSCSKNFRLRNNAFQKKLALWDSYIQKEDIEMCPLLAEFLIAADVKQKVIFN